MGPSTNPSLLPERTLSPSKPITPVKLLFRFDCATAILKYKLNGLIVKIPSLFFPTLFFIRKLFICRRAAQTPVLFSNFLFLVQSFQQPQVISLTLVFHRCNQVYKWSIIPSVTLPKRVQIIASQYRRYNNNFISVLEQG